MSYISIRDIHHSFGALSVLSGVSLDVEQEQIVSIIGKSGAGKTTLLQIIGTLLRPTSGEVRIGNKNVLSLSGKELAQFRNHHIGFVFQFHQLLPEFTAVENVMMPKLIAGDDFQSSRQRAEQMLRELGLGHRLTHKPNELSGGEKQRVAVARALIMNPDVVLADEPSGSLDSQNKQELHQLLLRVRNEFKKTIIIVTHDQALAAISDRVVRMEDGRIIP